MNIFVLDNDPIKAAEQQCDKHVVKMILETAQMLCSVHPNGDAPYKRTHYNHPCTIWSRQSLDNYEWLLLHGLSLSGEYRKRYGRQHKSEKVIKWCMENIPQLPRLGITKQPLCMPNQFKTGSVVQSYRNYYNGDKSRFAEWKHGNTPSWFTGKFTKGKLSAT